MGLVVWERIRPEEWRSEGRGGLPGPTQNCRSIGAAEGVWGPLHCGYAPSSPLPLYPAFHGKPHWELNTNIFTAYLYHKSSWGTSLVVQWLRIRLPMQGTRVRALVWEDPTCHGATRPVSHNYWACASGACAPQQERPRQWEARAPRWRVAPTRRN